MSAEPLLRVRSLSFAYGRERVLEEVDLDVADGEVVALLGTNGAGKSTLLRTVAGLWPPDAGEIRFAGRDVTRMGAERRVRAGMLLVPGGPAAFPSLTVLENLRCAAYTLRRDDAFEEAFERFPILHHRRDQRAATLSGGEQQMLSLARAFVLRPRLLMVDELTLGLAPVLGERLLDGVRAFPERGTTVLLVEQSAALALAVTSRAYFMERGRIRFSGPAAELAGRTDLLRSVFLQGAS